MLGRHSNKKWAFLLFSGCIFVGMFFMLQDRATEISLKWIGTIKAAAKQAAIDAESIAKIKERIEAQSATIDSIAKNAADARKIADEITQKNTMVETKIEEFNKLTLEATNKLKEIELITEFSKIAIAAQNDDRHAFDKLLSWADDKSFSMHEEAANVYMKIRTDYTIEHGYKSFNWPKNLEPSKLTILDLRKIYTSSPSLCHAYLVNFIQERDDLAKKDKMTFFIDVLKDDKSLNATYYAGKFFAEVAGIKWNPFSIKPLIEWWEQNKETIK